MLYLKYTPECWWWELIELSRKLILTGAILFIKPGFTTQVWFAILLSLFFLAVMAFFTPFRDPRIDFISFASQVSCETCSPNCVHTCHLYVDALCL